MTWLWIVLASLAGLVGALWIVGARTPRHHSVTVEAELPGALPEAVYAAIRGFASAASWRPDVRATTVEASDEHGPTSFVETSRHGAIRFELVEQTPPSRLVVRIADDSLPFAGRWTYRIAPLADGAGSRVSITEDGEVKTPLMRAMARLFMDPEASARTYLTALGAHLGCPPVTPRAVAG